MFDLFRSRDKVVRYTLTAFLSLVALSMIGYLIPGYGGGGGMTSDDFVIAEVGDLKVTVQEAQRMIQTAVRGRQVPSEMIGLFVPQLIDQLITERVLEYQAEEMGFRVSPPETAAAIRQTMPQLFPDGKFIGSETYQAVLQQQGLTVGEFEDTMRRQVMITRVRGLLQESVVVTKEAIEREYRRRNDKATIEFVRIAPETMRGLGAITANEIQEHYLKNLAQYQIPEARDLKLFVLDRKQFAATVSVSDGEAQTLYDRERERFRIPERVRVRHILLNTTDKSAEEQTKLKDQAGDLLKQLKGGANFAALARKVSDDPGSKEKGGDLDWVVRGQTVPEFEQAAFTLKPDELSDVIKTQYGFHIVQVQEKQEARLQPLAEVKADILSELRNLKTEETFQAALDQAVGAIRRDPASAEAVAQKTGLRMVNVSGHKFGDALPEAGANRDLDETIQALGEGQVSEVFELPSDRMGFAQVVKVIPSRQAELKEVEAQIRTALETEQRNAAMQLAASQLRAKLAEVGNDLRKAAQALGLRVQTSEPFSRNGAIEGLGAADSIPEAFTQPIGTVFGPTPMGDSIVVGRVHGRTETDMANLPAEEQALRDEIKNRLGRERTQLFEAGLRERLEKQRKLKINKPLLDRIVGSYRS